LTFRVRALVERARTPDDYPRLNFVANIKSQIKRNRTNEKARLRNKAVKSALKTAVKKVRTAIDAGDTAAAATLLADASRSLDKAASKGVIHKNQAANRKSALAKQLSALPS
jgi:small subunit ribosomal protein S20